MKVKAFRKKPKDGKGWFYYLQLITLRYMVILEWDFSLHRMWKIPKCQAETVDKGNYLVWDYVRMGWLFFTISFAKRQTYKVSVFHAVELEKDGYKGCVHVFNKCLFPDELNTENLKDEMKKALEQSYEQKVIKIVQITKEQYEKVFGNGPTDFEYKITQKKVKKVK